MRPVNELNSQPTDKDQKLEPVLSEIDISSLTDRKAKIEGLLIKGRLFNNMCIVFKRAIY